MVATAASLLTLTYTHTPPHPHTLTHTYTHPHTPTLTQTYPPTHPHSHIYPHTLTHTYTLTPSLTHAHLTHTHQHPLSPHEQNPRWRSTSCRTLCGRRHRNCMDMATRSSVLPAAQMGDTSHQLARFIAAFHSRMTNCSEAIYTSRVPFCSVSHPIPGL